MSKELSFISEETRDLVLNHQQAVLQKQKLDMALTRYRTIKAAEDRRREELKARAIEALRRIEHSWNPKDRRFLGVLQDVHADLQQGKTVTTEQLRQLQSLMSRPN